METYAIVRRNGWRKAADLEEAAARAAAEGETMSDDVAWIRSYVLEERDRSVGTICIYEARSPEAVRAHSAAAELPIDEILKVSGTVIVGCDPVPATA